MQVKTSTTFQKSADIVSSKINDMYGSKILISKQQVFSIVKKLNLSKLKKDLSEINKTVNIQDKKLYMLFSIKNIFTYKVILKEKMQIKLND